jgi:hypothetical protein
VNDIRRGSYTVRSVAHKRGYGYNYTNTYSIEIDPKEASPFDVPIPYLITYVAAIGIGIAALSFFFVRVIKTPKPSTDEVDEIEEEDEEEIEDVDLEEYETD